MVLLCIIYMAFISLGLPDTLLGAAWPAMQKELAVPISNAGTIFMISTGITIVSSFISEKVIHRFGTAVVTAVSIFMTALALLGFAYASSFIWLCMVAIPLGFGAGCVDAALNNYVALHFKAKHMNWLHCAWGIGAFTGPFILSFVYLEWMVGDWDIK